MEDSKSNDGCIINGAMPKEEELGGIFEEKLYVNKRTPFKESNFLTKDKKNLTNWREEINNKELAKGGDPNVGGNTVVDNYKEEKKNKTDANNKRETLFGKHCTLRRMKFINWKILMEI